MLGISLLHMHIWFLYSGHMDPCFYYMYYCAMFPYSCYMIISCYWYGYSHYWTWELLICDMWTSTSIDLVILFPLYCFRYIVPDSCYIVLCYQQSSGPVIMLPVSCTVICSCYIGYLTYQIIMITGLWGRLDGWLDLIGWCTGSILFSHCRGW